MLDQRIINLYDEYTHKPLSRKVFMLELVKLVGSTAAALSMLSLLESGCAPASKASTEALFLENISYPVDAESMNAIISRTRQTSLTTII